MFSLKNEKSVLGLIIGLKLVLVIILLFTVYSSADKQLLKGIICNDFEELLGPVNSLIENGTYALEKKISEPYAGRLPGYMFPYVLFRALFSQGVSIILLVIFQVSLSIAASYSLYLTLKKLLQTSGLISLCATAVFTLVNFSGLWELRTAGESLSLSCFVIGSYFLIKATSSSQLKHYFIAGLFLAWMFFLRGFLLLYFFPAGLFILLPILNSRAYKKGFVSILIFMLPVLIFEGAWITRNYVSSEKIIPLQDNLAFEFTEENLNENYPFGSTYKPTIRSLRKLVAMWGGNNVHFYPKTEMAYFLTEKPLVLEDHFPEYLFKDEFKKEGVENLKSLCTASYNEEASLEEKIKAEKLLWNTVKKEQELFAKTHTFYSLMAPFNRLLNLTAQNVTSDWPGRSFSDNSILYKVYKLATLACYFLVVFSFPVVLVISFIQRKKLKAGVFYFIGCVSVLSFIFMFLVNVAEFKYFITGFTACLIALSVTVDSVLKQFKKS